MEGNPTNRAKGIPNWLVRLCKWLWKMNGFLWASIISSILVGIGTNLVVSQPEAFDQTVAGWLLQHPVIILVVGISLFLFNMVIYLVSHLEIGFSKEESFSDNELKRLYLKRMIRETEVLTLKGIPAGLIASSVPLDDVFIPSQFRRNRPSTDYPLTEEELHLYQNVIKNAVVTDEAHRVLLEAEKSWEHMQKETAEINLTNFWQQLTREHPVVVIQGYPGMGKTTLLARLTLHMARRSLGEPDLTMPGNLEPPLIPISLSLQDYARECMYNSSDFSLSDYLKLVIERLDIPGLNPFLEKALNAGRCLFMFDGLDEVSDTKLKKNVQESIKSFLLEHCITSYGATSFNRALITTRVAGYDQQAFPDYPHYLIAELTTEQCENFLLRWSHARMPRSHVEREKKVFTKEAAEMAKNFNAAFTSNRDIWELAKNPLLLTLLAVMQQNSIVLPTRRVELYRVVTNTLLENRNIVKNLAPIPEAQAIQRLGLLAFYMQETGNSFVNERDVMDSLTQTIGAAGGTPESIAEEAVNFLMRVRERGGLFVQRTDNYFGFTHLAFQEYFAARYMLNQIKLNPDEGIRELIRRVRNTNTQALWHEPFLLAVAFQSTENEQVANEILRALLTSPQGANRESDVLLAAECLIESKPLTIEHTLERQITEHLLQIYETVQKQQDFDLCDQIEKVMRHWLESLPKEAYHPVLLKVLQKAVSDEHDMAHRNATLALLKRIGWTKRLEAIERANEYTMTD